MTRPSCISHLRFGRESGFTLIELIAVLTLIGILAAVIFPKFASTPSFQERILTDQLMNMVLKTRLHALSRESQNLALRVTKNEHWQLDIVAKNRRDERSEQTLVSEKLAEGRAELSVSVLGRTPLNINEGMLFEFDRLGNIAQLNHQALTANIYLKLAEKHLCISPAGLAWQPASKQACEHG